MSKLDYKDMYLAAWGPTMEAYLRAHRQAPSENAPSEAESVNGASKSSTSLPHSCLIISAGEPKPITVMAYWMRENILLRQENIVLRKKLERILKILQGDIFLDPWSDVGIPRLSLEGNEYIHPANAALKEARTFITRAQPDDWHRIPFQQVFGHPDDRYSVERGLVRAADWQPDTDREEQTSRDTRSKDL